MRILFVTDLCPLTDTETGLPEALLEFILNFKKSGNSVTLFRPNVILNVLLRGRKLLPDGKYSYRGISCINKNYFSPLFSVSQFDFLKNQKFDVILSHMPSGILAAEKISKLLKIPYFAAVHSSDIRVLTNIRYFFLRGRMKSAYKNAKMVMPRSFWLKDKIEKIIPEIKGKTGVIPSGIDSVFYIPDEKFELKKKKFYGKPYKFFAAGSLIRRKNFSSLIEAIKKTKNTELIIAGNGPERGRLESLITRLNLKDRVKLLGRKDRFEILKIMEDIPFFILPSDSETFGLVYLEAMAKGSVVICTKNSGMAGFIKDGINGFLTENGIVSMAETIQRVLNAKNLEAVAESALDTAKNMEMLKMSENYLNLIQNNRF